MKKTMKSKRKDILQYIWLVPLKLSGYLKKNFNWKKGEQGRPSLTFLPNWQKHKSTIFLFFLVENLWASLLRCCSHSKIQKQLNGYLHPVFIKEGYASFGHFYSTNTFWPPTLFKALFEVLEKTSGRKKMHTVLSHI